MEVFTEEVLPTLDTVDAFEVFEPLAEEKVERVEAVSPVADEPALLPVLLQLVDSFRTDLPWPSLLAMLGAILIWFASLGLFAVD